MRPYGRCFYGRGTATQPGGCKSLYRRSGQSKPLSKSRTGAMFVATAGDRSCRTPGTGSMRRGSRACPPSTTWATMPPVYDQGQLGSCTGNAIAGAMEYERDRQGLSDFVPSRLFIYYNERATGRHFVAPTTPVPRIRDGIKVGQHRGASARRRCGRTTSGFFHCEAAAGAATCAAKERYGRFSTRSTQTLGLTCKDGDRVQSLGRVRVHGATRAFEFAGRRPDGRDAVCLRAVIAVVGGHAVLAVGYPDLKGQAHRSQLVGSLVG